MMIFSISLLCSCIFYTCIHSLSISLQPNSEQCYNIYLKPQQAARFYGYAIDAIDVTLRMEGPEVNPITTYNPNKEIVNMYLIRKIDTITTSETIDAKRIPPTDNGGYYFMCFYNRNDKTIRDVIFVLTYGIIYEPHKEKEKEKQAERISNNVKDSMDNLLYTLHKIHTEQEYNVKRRERHMQTLQSNQSRSFWYNLIQLAALLVTGIAEIKIFQMWFANTGIPQSKRWGV